MQEFHQRFTQTLNSQISGYYARQDAQAKQVSNWCDNINGLTNVTDPKTGAKFQVFTCQSELKPFARTQLLSNAGH